MINCNRDVMKHLTKYYFTTNMLLNIFYLKCQRTMYHTSSIKIEALQLLHSASCNGATFRYFNMKTHIVSPFENYMIIELCSLIIFFFNSSSKTVRLLVQLTLVKRYRIQLTRK